MKWTDLEIILNSGNRVFSENEYSVIFTGLMAEQQRPYFSLFRYYKNIASPIKMN